MSDPSKKPDHPEATLVDSLDDGVAPTAVNPAKALTPVGKRPTNSELPAVTLPPDPPPPAPARGASGQRQRITGKRPTQSHPALTPQPDGATPLTHGERRRVSDKHAAAQPVDSEFLPTPIDPPLRTAPDESGASTINERRRTTGRRQVPATTEPEVTVTPTNAPAPAEVTVTPTEARPPRAIGPTGTLDTTADSDGASTFVGDETGTPTTGSNRVPAPAPTPTRNLPSAKPVALLPPESTVNHGRQSSTRPFTGLDEASFRRGLAGLAAGVAAILVLTVVWVFVKLDDGPQEVGQAKPLARPGDAKPKPVAKAPVVEAQKPLMIEQTVDAGMGETRTVLAAAGTVRIVTDPDANVFIDGKDLGVAPVLVTLPAGKNTVVLENKKLFFKRTVTVEVEANEQTATRFAFSMGWLEIDAPKDSKVTVDGRPATSTHVQVWEGSHRVEAVHADKKRTRASQTAEVTPGMTTSVHFDAPSIADE